MDAVKSGVAQRIEVLLLMLPPLMLLLPLLLLLMLPPLMLLLPLLLLLMLPPLMLLLPLLLVLMLPPLMLSDDLLSLIRGYLLTHSYRLTLSLHALLAHSFRHLYFLL